MISRFLDILIFPLFDIRLFKFYSIFIAQTICRFGHQLVFRRGFLLLALAVILLGFIVAFVVYDLRNRNKELHSYIHKTYICHVVFEIRLGIGLSGFHCCLRVNQHSKVTNKNTRSDAYPNPSRNWLFSGSWVVSNEDRSTGAGFLNSCLCHFCHREAVRT